MGIIVKFFIRNIRENLFRTFLILFAVAISSALFFASSAITDTMVKMFLERTRQSVGNADLMITENEKTQNPFFGMERLLPYRDSFEYAVGAVSGSGAWKQDDEQTVNISLRGMDFADAQKLSPITIEKDFNIQPFTGRKLIVSRATAQKYGFKLGDKIELSIKGNIYKFTLSAIAIPTGLFLEDGQTTMGLVPKDIMANIYNATSQVNVCYIKLKDAGLKNEIINKLSPLYRRYSVKEPFSEQELKQQLASVSTSFLFMTVLVLFTSVFIIYTSFKVITMERLPVIGTFRSIGATRKMTDRVLIGESLFYGIVGGALGSALGIGILYIMSVMTTPPWMKDIGIKTQIVYQPYQLVMAFCLAIILAFISSVIPIIQVSKIPVKDIVLNTIQKPKKRPKWRFVLGAVLLTLAFVLPPITPKQLAMAVNLFSMMFCSIGIIMLVPHLTAGFVMLFERAYIFIFGNIGIIAAKNLRENKSILNNISLLSIGISSLLMINTISYSVINEMTNLFANSTYYDISIGAPKADKNFMNILKTVDGVSDVCSFYQSFGVQVPDKKQQITIVHGISDEKYFDYWRINPSPKPTELTEGLQQGRNIMLSVMILERLNAKVGDTISLDINKQKRAYKIIGTADTMMFGGGYGLIADKYFKIDFQVQNPTSFCVRANLTAEQVIKNIKAKFSDTPLVIMTIKEIARMNIEMNQNILSVMKGFSAMTLVIAIFGVFNNYIISYLERRRYLAIYRSVGMNKRQLIQMMIIESITGGLIGGLIGMLGGAINILMMPYTLKAMNTSIPIIWDYSLFGYALIAGVVITLAASLSPLFKSSKINIIEAIKYE